MTTPAQPEINVARYGSYTTTWDVITAIDPFAPESCLSVTLHFLPFSPRTAIFDSGQRLRPDLVLLA